MRRLSETVSVPIRGSEDATQPFFSPDGRWLGFYQRSEFKKVAVTGGAPVSLATTVAATGASWTDDDRILVGRGPDGIWQVPADGGAFEPLTTVEDGEAAGHPQLLPGGEWLLYTLRPGDATDWRDAQVVAQSLGTGERAVLIRGGSGGRYVPTGHLVYVLDGTLWGVAFELETRTVTSEPVALAELADNPRSGALHLGLSTDGVLAYLAGAAGPVTGSVLG